MLERFKIGTRLSVSFAIATFIILILGAAGYFGISRAVDNADDIATSHATLLELSQSNRAEINLMRRFEKDAFINLADPAKVDEYRKKWELSLTSFTKQNDAMLKLVDTAQEREAISAIKKQSDEYAVGFRNVCSLIASGEITTTQDANKAIGQYKNAIHQTETLVADFSKLMHKDLDEMVTATHRDAKTFRLIIGILAVVSASLATLLAILITRSITAPLHTLVTAATTIAAGDLTTHLAVTSNDETGQLTAAMKAMTENLRTIIGQVTGTASQVAAAATQLNATAGTIAAGAEDVAAQSGTVATAGEEMSATSGDIAQNCQMASEGAQRASQSASDGAQVVERTVVVMGQIAEKVLETAKTVESLGARSDQIGNIIGTIEDIADQTNLLALNAAIEAARAGEQGRGFAVVADEVRALAERTTRATREISVMIKAIQSETKGAVLAMEQGVQQVEAGTEEAAKSGNALREILEQVNDVAMQVNQIATAAEEQTATTSEISSNMLRITEVVQHTSQGAQESSSAAARLNDYAGELQRLVRQFTL
jgi:methyl-accepting chemotaxis protein